MSVRRGSGRLHMDCRCGGGPSGSAQIARLEGLPTQRLRPGPVARNNGQRLIAKCCGCMVAVCPAGPYGLARAHGGEGVCPFRRS
jgi:hypothetical protein